MVPKILMLLAACLFYSVGAFHTRGGAKGQNVHRFPSQLEGRRRLAAKAAEEQALPLDPYSDLLDLDRPIETTSPLLSLVSIKPEGEDLDGSALANKPPAAAMLKQRQSQQWVGMDERTQRLLGDLEKPVDDNDNFQLALRDALELKRGYAIWSKRSDKDIQREIKKNQASKAMQMPEKVTMVIQAVFIDKTHTLKEIKKEDQLACIEYRKWLNEQRGKLKKDPLPAAKVEVSKRWLTDKPSNRSSRKKGELPSNLLDDFKEPVPGVAFATESGSAKASSTSTSSAAATFSMTNWDKTESEVNAADNALASTSFALNSQKGVASLGAGTGQSSDSTLPQFKVDLEDIFVATDPQQEYYVVI